MSKKTLFIENSLFLTRLSVSDELKESIQIKQGKNNTLIVKNVPATILNRGNQNGRIYSTVEMQKALDAAKQQISTKQLLCQADEHPEGSFVAPTHTSHVVTSAYIKKNVKLEVEGETGTWDVLFCDIEVLNTQEGKNLQALLLSGVSIGTSIRGLGDMEGDQVVNYEFLGFDVVSNPSSGTFTNMPIYEAKIESADVNKLNEATKFTVSTYASNTTHDLQQAIEFQDKASTSLQYGTITNMNTKMDQEVDPKTGVEKTIGEVEVETSDDTSDLKTALEIAGRAFTNPENINVTSITIEKIDEDDMKDSVMQGGASNTLKEEDPTLEEDSAGKKLYDLWNREFGGKNQVVLTAIGPMGIFPAYDGTKLMYGRCNQNGVVDRYSVEGEVPYNAEEDLKDQVMQVANKINEEYGYEGDLLDASQKQPENTLQEQELTQGMWIKTELLDHNAVYYVDSVNDSEVALIKNSDHGPKIKLELDGSFVFPWSEVQDESTSKKEFMDLNVGNSNVEVNGDNNNVSSSSSIDTDITATLPLPEAAPEGEIEQNNNTLTINVDGEEVEKEFNTNVEASVAKTGLENGELTANVMYDESGSWWGLKVSAGDMKDWYITDEGNGVDVNADENLALVFPTEEEAKKFQQENGCEEYEYNNGLRSSVVPVQMGITDEEIFGKQEANIDEKLYSQEDPASDDLQQQPVMEEIKDLKVTLGDISYDVDEEPDFEGDPSEIESVLSHLPETIEVELNGVDVPEDNAEEFIYQKACEQTGLPIKNATIVNVEEIEKEEVKEEGEEDGLDMDMDATSDMASDSMGGLDGTSGAMDVADVSADDESMAVEG